MRLEFEILVTIDRFSSTLNSLTNNDARSSRPYEARPMKGGRRRDRGGGRARPAVTGAGPGPVPLSAAARPSVLRATGAGSGAGSAELR